MDKYLRSKIPLCRPLLQKGENNMNKNNVH
jgi:hypothetical protein